MHGSKSGTAEYIHAMALELGVLARAAELPAVAYLLDMAALAAEQAANEPAAAGVGG